MYYFSTKRVLQEDWLLVERRVAWCDVDTLLVLDLYLILFVIVVLTANGHGFGHIFRNNVRAGHRDRSLLHSKFGRQGGAERRNDWRYHAATNSFDLCRVDAGKVYRRCWCALGIRS